MYVYLHGSKQQVGRHSMYVTPAKNRTDIDANPEWFSPDGTPQMLELFFENGKLAVDENLGKFLVSNGMASAKPPSRLIMPDRGLINS